MLGNNGAVFVVFYGTVTCIARRHSVRDILAPHTFSP